MSTTKTQATSAVPNLVQGSDGGEEVNSKDEKAPDDSEMEDKKLRAKTIDTTGTIIIAVLDCED